jgi:hypothetical protein
MKKLFYLLLALPFVVASCEKKEEPAAPVKDPVLTLTSEATMEFTAEGDEGTITYTLQNAKEGVELTATCEANWVSTPVVGDTITFTVAANDGDARETKIVVAYDALSFEVAVKQAAKQQEEPKPSTPVFELTSATTAEYTCEETIGEITYKLENPVQGVEVSVKANASWISNLKANNGTISFLVAANDGDAREGKITAEYGPLSFSVTVKQSEYVAPAPVLVIDSSDNEFQAEGGDGEIAYHVDNAVEGTEVAATTEAEWITINSVADGIVAYTVAANETENIRDGIITVTYGELSESVAVKQFDNTYNPDFEYRTFEVVECWAESKNDGKQWNVVFVEHHAIQGDMQTILSFSLPEANINRLNDGTYSVENGGILTNTYTNNGFSSYRDNSSEATDITAASFTVNVDTDKKSISIVGSFTAGNVIVSLNYTGEMKGMALGDTTISDTYTEWSTIKKNYQDASELIFTAISADGSLEARFTIKHSGGTKVCPEGTYEVKPWAQGLNDYLISDSKISFNTVEENMASGYITVEHIAGGYKFTFDITDTANRNFKGVIEGPIENGTNPA